MRRLLVALSALILLGTGFPGFAQAAAASKIDTGDTAFMLLCTILVLLMTIPGLALFYGGMVRKRNILAIMAQSFSL